MCHFTGFQGGSHIDDHHENLNEHDIYNILQKTRGSKSMKFIKKL